ncbi:MAG: YkgJ family cysteine cluster protein [Gammaproteobacteria bacterium]|nr:YkgJ family cysteine cluster protein [Gammaproteobacteria bacterium]
MSDARFPPAGTFDAGPFGAWLSKLRASLRGDAGMDVPCGDCTGCCTSGYSIQLRRTDGAARALVPSELVVEAPGFAPGDLTLPARDDGTCPMLHSGRCSIYAQRPQTCLDYDCRIFAAAGLDAGGADKAVINRRVRAWRFSYEGEAERRSHDAVRTAARFIRERPEAFSALGVRVPAGPMGIAVLAIKAHAALLDPAAPADDAGRARAMIAAGRAYDGG